jgi:hypothetical protein
MGVLRDLGATVMQIATNLQPRQQAAARKVLSQTLKDLRKILADSGDE